jgi:hypothetical protein
MSDPFNCEGEISEVNPSTILFEFLGPSGERSVGFVKTEDVKVRHPHKNSSKTFRKMYRDSFKSSNSLMWSHVGCLLYLELASEYSQSPISGRFHNSGYGIVHFTNYRISITGKCLLTGYHYCNRKFDIRTAKLTVL